MAELTGDGPDIVAYQLLLGLAAAEGKTVQGGFVVADRQWTLQALRDIYQSMNHLVRK